MEGERQARAKRASRRQASQGAGAEGAVADCEFLIIFKQCVVVPILISRSRLTKIANFWKMDTFFTITHVLKNTIQRIFILQIHILHFHNCLFYIVFMAL